MSIANRIRNAGKDTGNTKEEDQCVSKAKGIWQYVSTSRRSVELDWYINDQFYNNNHYLKYNLATRQVQALPAEQTKDKVVINRTKQQVRAVVSFLNREHPQVTVLPGSQADDSYLRAIKEKHLVDYWYDHLQMNKKNKLITKDGCKYGIGWVKILWDQDALAPTVPYTMEDGSSRSYQYGEVMYERVDPFEVFPDPVNSDKSSMRFLVHALPRTVGELKNNKLYKNQDRIAPDRKLAASWLKESQIRQSLTAAMPNTPGEAGDLQTTLVLETFMREWSTYKNKWEVQVVTMTDNGVLLREQTWPLDEFPFEYYQSDVEASPLNTHGVIHDIREPNRALNQMVSQVHETAKVMGKLNWVMPRGSNVNVITDETGQFIEYDVTPGGRPQQAQPAGLPNYIPNHVAYLDRAIQDIGGAGEGLLGKTPFAQASGDLMQNLQESDSSNLSMSRDNFDDFQVRAYKLMLKTAKVNGKSKRQFRVSGKDELGQYRWIELKPSDISVEDDVQVRSGTNTPYSVQQKQQMYLSLYKEGVIKDPAAVLKLMELPDVANALGDDELDIERQVDEIKRVIDGKKIDEPVIAENHSVHMATLDKFIRGTRWKELKPEQQKLLLDHRSQHADFQSQLAKSAALMQYDPIKRNETVQIRVNRMGDATPMERGQLLKEFNVNSDAFQIQQRGGLVVQDPAEAERQAQNEDMEMMDGRPVQISLGDNHEVHLETHYQVMNTPQFMQAPVNMQDLFKAHVKAHEQAMRDLQPAPGLMPDGTENITPQPMIKQ